MISLGLLLRIQSDKDLQFIWVELSLPAACGLHDLFPVIVPRVHSPEIFRALYTIDTSSSLSEHPMSESVFLISFKHILVALRDRQQTLT